MRVIHGYWHGFSPPEGGRRRSGGQRAEPELFGLLSVVILVWCLMSSATTGAERNSAELIVIPIEIVNSFPLFEGFVNGHELTLTFDLGSDSTFALMPDGLRIARPDRGDRKSQRSDVKGNIVETATFKIRSLKIGTTEFTNVATIADAHDPSYPAPTGREQGVIGEPLFKPYRLVLDYPHKRIILIPQSRRQPEKDGCTGDVVRFLPEWNGEPLTKLQTDLGDLVMTWDTGSPISIVSRSRIDRAKATVIDKAYTSNRAVMGNTNYGRMALRVLDFSQPPGIDGFIGNDFFAKHVVCIDFPGNRLLIQ